MCSKLSSQDMDSGTWTTSVISSSFCVSQDLKNIHVLALQYVSAFYPLLLITLTYACVELHGHNFRPIVWLWKPFHRCCVNARRRWDTKASLIDVFATFLLLSYSKFLYVSLYLLDETVIHNADGEHVSGTSRPNYWCHCALFKWWTPSICHHCFPYLGFYTCPSISADFLPLQSI